MTLAKLHDAVLIKRAPRRFRGGLVVLACVLAVSVVSWSSPLRAEESGDRFLAHVMPLLDRYCVECHMEDEAQGGIALDQFDDQAEALAGGRTWVQVLDAIEGGLMPPAEMPQPSADAVNQLRDWIENDFFVSQCGDASEIPPIVVRRLNRQEYDNTIRDLIGMDLGLAKDFPPDDMGFGYDNIGSVLNLSPAHIEKYLDAAERALEAAIMVPDSEAFSPVELIGLRTYPLESDRPVEFEHHLAPGRYLADFSLVRVGIAESVPPPQLLIGFGTDARTLTAVRVQDETIVYRFWITVLEGDNQVRVAVVPRQLPDDLLSEEVSANVSGDQRYGGDAGLHVDSMVVRGPVELDIETLPESHAKILFREPDVGDQSRRDCAAETIRRFSELAFRRPVTSSEVEGVLGIFQIASDRGESFERSMQVALSTVLVSPRFLFLVEPEDAQEGRPLDEYQLASRLSYFLWSTMPDEILMRQAAQGTLRQNLHAQTERMLNDPKSGALVGNFVGQWLQLRKLSDVSPDAELFPGFNASLRNAMLEETEHFFSHLLRQNRSVLELIDAPYTFVNDELAEHYGFKNVIGDEFRKVDLTDRRRGGVLTHASILTLTSNPNRTSPVKRGKWVLQQLLGSPPPPPPPGVEELDESEQAAESASLRERLEIHRKNPECASCHNQMDPIGFALENYDAVGRWRNTDGEFTIDPSGELRGKRQFRDSAEFRMLLKRTDSKRFTRCFIENLLTYALGRNLEPFDYCTVEEIRKRLVRDDHRIRNVVFGIIESDAFQHRKLARE